MPPYVLIKTSKSKNQITNVMPIAPPTVVACEKT